jgi:hypothetical protein
LCLLLLLLLPSGLTGYCAYAPSKFAVRGLAECLRNEVRLQPAAVLLLLLLHNMHGCKHQI